MELQTLFWNADISDIKRGFVFNKESGNFICLICGESFEKDIVYPVNDQFFNAYKMTEHHIASDHGGMFNYMINLNKSYTSLSENQTQVLIQMNQGLSDSEIAKNLSITTSTIRNYRFKFREKEKQAKIFLSLMHSVNANKSITSDSIIQPHRGATQIDERYDVTEKDRLKTLESYFDEHGKLVTFPSKQKKKIIVLNQIAKNFKEGRVYSENEINIILKRIFEDYVLIRRYLIQYGFLDRHVDGKSYWVK